MTKRQRVKFPCDLYWENKTYKLKRSIPRNPVQHKNPGGGGLLNKCSFEEAPTREQPLTLYNRYKCPVF